MSNNKIPLAIAIATTLTTGSALAAEQSPHTFTSNVGLYSQYIFRGLTQTNEDPALQGGMDYLHSSGVYVGFWGSNISWLRDAAPPQTYNEGGSLELDLYGGFRGNFGKTDFTYDLGFLYYWYPGDTPSGAIKADTKEVYGALGWKWLSAKYSYSFDDTFGVKDADGTWYLDLSANVPLGETGLTLGLHYGMQEYDGSDPRNVGGANNDDIYSYDDWKVSLAYDLGKVGKPLTGTTIGVMYTDTSSADDRGYGKVSQGGPYPKNIADDQVTFWIQRVF
jgi:uncharacterized protein (TIGR02001 family)